MAENGWTFNAGDGVIPDNVNHTHYLYQIYNKAEPTYSGRVTVPILWDKKTEAIVSNESSEIIRMFNSAFNKIGANEVNFYPDHLADEINLTSGFTEH